MSYKELDSIFPWFILCYGALMTFVLNCPPLVRLADRHLPEQLNAQITAHRGLGVLCLVLGACWTLQNLWLA